MWVRAIISGERRDAPATAMRLLLTLLAWLYRLVVVVRNRLYDLGWRPTQQVSVPVICVGNITAGGTGKTPMVVWLCRRLQQQHRKVVVLARGYQRKGDGDNDETEMLRRLLPDVPIVIDADRVRGAQTALAQHQADAIVLDDGFQHRRLGRDLDIVMLDCTCPFGYGHLLPRGLLREPVRALRRAGAVVLTHSDQVSESRLFSVAQRVQQIADAKMLIAHSCHAPTGLYDVDERDVLLEKLRGRRVVAFCGIGNPQAFVETVKQLGAKVAAVRFFNDHHHYNECDCEALIRLARENEVELLITTEKDWVKLKHISVAKEINTLRWLRIEAVIHEGSTELCEKLDSLWHR